MTMIDTTMIMLIPPSVPQPPPHSSIRFPTAVLQNRSWNGNNTKREKNNPRKSDHDNFDPWSGGERSQASRFCWDEEQEAARIYLHNLFASESCHNSIQRLPGELATRRHTLQRSQMMIHVWEEGRGTEGDSDGERQERGGREKGGGEKDREREGRKCGRHCQAIHMKKTMDKRHWDIILFSFFLHLFCVDVWRQKDRCVISSTNMHKLVYVFVGNLPIKLAQKTFFLIYLQVRWKLLLTSQVFNRKLTALRKFTYES